jgi:hypothetical protein
MGPSSRHRPWSENHRLFQLASTFRSANHRLFQPASTFRSASHRLFQLASTFRSETHRPFRPASTSPPGRHRPLGRITIGPSSRYPTDPSGRGQPTLWLTLSLHSFLLWQSLRFVCVLLIRPRVLICTGVPFRDFLIGPSGRHRSVPLIGFDPIGQHDLSVGNSYRPMRPTTVV